MVAALVLSLAAASMSGAADLVVRTLGRDIGVRVPLPRLLSDVP